MRMHIRVGVLYSKWSFPYVILRLNVEMVINVYNRASKLYIIMRS